MLYDNDKIRLLRGKLGISINELARRAKIRGPSMWAIEKGKTKNVRAQTLIDIAAALGVPVQEILKASKNRGSQALESQIITVFANLEDKNRQAILAAAQALLQQQKKS